MPVIDAHTHTSSGSRCGYQTPRELISRAKQAGLDGVCFTDHDWVWPRSDIEALGREHDFLVIGGAEVSTDHGDILVYGVHRPLRDVFRIEALRRLVDEEGGLMLVAHPFRGMLCTGLTIEQACAWDVFKFVDGTEVINGRSFSREVAFSCAVARRLGLFGLGGSDAHAADFVGDAVTVFDRPVVDEESFMAELRAGRCRAEHRVLGQSYAMDRATEGVS